MENSYPRPDGTVNLLDEFDVSLIQASGGKRFANWIIDRIIIYIIWRIFSMLIGFPILLPTYRLTGSIFTLWLELFFEGVVQDILTYTAIEFLGRGTTIGKLVTGTRAVNEDGTTISFRTALLRSVCRIVPFEIFSALGNPCWPWHDRWTKTYVIDERQSRLPPKL